MRRFYQVLKVIFHRRRLEQDLHDELDAHLKMDASQRMRAGESVEGAHYGARRQFGNLLRHTEDVRESWGTAGIDRFTQDVRYAFRQMKRQPGFVIVAILSLGLGIGANTAVFSIVNAILLRPLPYKNSDRLVRIVENIPATESFSGAPERTTRMSPDAFVEWRSRTKTLSGMAMERQVSMTVGGPQPVRLSGFQVSPALFRMLDVRPLLGRTFEPNEEKAGADKVVILSHTAWVNYRGADPQLVGKAIMLDNNAYTVIGIMPREFMYPDPQTQFWIPLALPVPNILGLPVIARLKDAIPISGAAEEATTIAREFRGESPNDPQQAGPPRVQLLSVKDELVAPIRLPFLVFVIAVTFVLLIACINVANLFLARSAARSHEIAIRMALGAGQVRVLRQLLTENFILVFLGGAVGIALAFFGNRLFVMIAQSLIRTDLVRFDLTGNVIPRLNEVTIDTSVLLFTLILTLASGVLCGLIPAVRIGRITPIRAACSRISPSSKVPGFLRTALVIGQIGLTTVLLLGAGLLIKSFLTIANRDLGYDPSNVVTFKIPQPALDYPRDLPKQILQNIFAEEVVRRLESLPDVEAAAFTNELPMTQGFFSWLSPEAGRARRQEGRIAAVSRDYFQTMRMRVIAGRAFDASDVHNPRPVYIINKTAAREHFRSENPIGKTVSGAGFRPGEIVGIVDDIRQSGLDAEPVPQLFMNPHHMEAVYGLGYYFVVRTRNAASAIVPAIRSIVHEVDPTRAIDNVATMNQIVSNSITTPRSYAVLLGTFAAAALGLAMVGLYGLLTYFVKERTQEIGIRVALGAQKRRVLLLILGQGLSLSVAGVIAGIAGGAALTKYIQKMLFGMAALDSGTFVIVSVLFMVIALLASYVPARHAANVDPLVALRYE